MKKIRIIGVILSLAMMMSLLAGCGGDTATDPKEAVKDAISATADEFGTLAGKSPLAEINKAAVSGSMTQNVELYLADAGVGYDLSDFYGTGLVMSAVSDYSVRQIMSACNIIIAGYDALGYEVAFDDDMIYMSCEDILGDTVFGMNTMTITEDLQDTYGDLGITSGYNVFDIIDEYISDEGGFAMSIATMSKLSSAYDALLDASSFAEAVDTTISCDGASVDCQRIDMTITGEAFSTFAAAVSEAVLNDSYIKLVFESVAIGSYGYASYDEFVSDALVHLEAGLAEASDITASFYLDDMLRGADLTFAGGSLEIRFGAENVYDYIEAVMTIDEAAVEVKLVSTGNHGFDGGVFENTTELRVKENDYAIADFTVNSSYDSSTEAYSFNMLMFVDGTDITVISNGTAAIADDAVTATIDSLNISSMGMYLDFEGAWDIATGGETDINTDNVMMIADMTEADIEELSDLASTNAMYLVMDIMSAVPQLATLLGF